MNNKFCVKCGHANPSISNGIAVRFCSKCGHDMSSTSSFATKKTNPRRTRQNTFSVEIEEESEHDFSQGIDIEYEVNEGPKMTFGDIAGKGPSGFSRSKGAGSKNIQKEIYSDCKSNRGNPEDA